YFCSRSRYYGSSPWFA
nr:immunoglobulin heavy chain junction region [Mus musculus]